MKQDLFDKLKTTYPDLFHSISQIECDNGWYDLIDSACLYIYSHLDYVAPSLKGGVYFRQIKEKMGGLRLYLNKMDASISAATDVAEIMSGHICETCGNKGSARNVNHYLFTACDQHFELKNK